MLQKKSVNLVSDTNQLRSCGIIIIVVNYLSPT